MARIHFKAIDGTERIVDAMTNTSIMEAAIGAAVPGIVAECGGGCACATCHVYLDDQAFEEFGSPSEMEQGMLDFASAPLRLTSRLGCQVKMTGTTKDVIVYVPESQ